ncbi:MAG TPA: ABC transporter substrate-binding protein [Casimicrobiaceae bacterium]|nr:ABC transporter substrate-binding protein [Casimicrobiaceae bacterium]
MCAQSKLGCMGLSIVAAAVFLLPPSPAVAQTEINVPILVPITGFLSLEGTSQRNGALLAIRNAPAGVKVTAEVTDTGASPEGATTALERALSRGRVSAVVASMLGTQMLAMLPIGLENKVPLVTVSGTADITEKNNPYVFRFFPGDAVAKGAHVRYVLDELKKKRVALVYQTTAYGQSGRRHIVDLLKKAGLEPAMEEALDVTIKDMSTVIGKVQAANPDVVLLHLHGGPSALFLKQAAASKLNLPIVAGSGLSQPSTVALLEPAELKDVCAETNASPVAGGSPEMERFLAQYRAEFKSEPDGFAVGQYDATAMVIDAAAKGAKTAEDIRKALSGSSYKGLAMTYKSDGKGNMAASAVIICYDGSTRTPKIAKRYEG